jgi:hypothetical protein
MPRVNATPSPHRHSSESWNPVPYGSMTMAKKALDPGFRRNDDEAYERADKN